MENIFSFLIENPLIELGLITLILVIGGFIAKTFKQPILIGYILSGLVLGPQVFDLIHHYENIEFYAHFGVSLLLFMIGLGLNPSIVHEVGKVSTIAGVGQVIFTSLIGFGLSLVLGFSLISSLFIAIALTFSSTIIIVKLVSDRGDAGTTYGKIAFGILIVQDIIAMLILLAISAFTMHSYEQGVSVLVGTIILKVLGLLAFARLFTKYIATHIISSLAKYKELLLLFVITRAILFGGLWYYAGFSMEIGALLAGITLASSRFRFHIFSELRPFRDFFLALFFVYLGGQIVFTSIGSLLIPIIVLSAFVLIGNPIIVVTLMMKLGYNSKDSFMTGLTVAQISEFSFIVISLALGAGILEDQNMLSFVTIIGLVTMIGSSYMFSKAESLYKYVSKYLKKYEKRSINTSTMRDEHEYKIIIIGYGRLGQYTASRLKQHQIPFCIIENDIGKVEKAEKAGFTVIYGDIADNDTLENQISTHTQLIYSTVSDHDETIQLLTLCKEAHPQLKIIVLALYIDEAENLYQYGADYVIFPHLSGADESWNILEKHVREPEQFIISKIKSLEAIQMHKSFLLDH